MKTKNGSLLLFLLIGSILFVRTEKGVVQPEPPNRKNSLGLEYGLHHLQRQDLAFSPLVYRGQALPNLHLTFRRINGRRQQAVDLGVKAFSATSNERFTYLKWRTLEPTETLPSTFVGLHLRYTYLRHLNSSAKLKVWAGAGLENQIDAMFLEFGGAGAFGYGTYLSLSPTGQLQYLPSPRTSFFAELAVPLVSWVARSPYAVNDDGYIWNQRSHQALPTLLNLMGDGEVSTLNQLQQVRLQVGYQRALSGRFSFRTRYEGTYARYTRPRQTITLTNSLSFGLQYHF